MRVNLSQEAVKAVGELQTRLSKDNPHLETEVTPFLNGLLGALIDALTEKQIERIAPALTSNQHTQKRKLALLKRLSHRLDNALLEELEKQFPDEREPAKKVLENEAKSAEIR